MTAFEHFYEFFVPDHYQLFFDIDRAKKEISGKTTITGTAKQADIAIHQKDLTIASVEVNNLAATYTVDDEKEAIRISLPEAGDVTITIAYKTKLTDTMMGIYPSYYEVDGVKKQLIGTQFETNSARQAFPCVDEPEAKATFAVSIRYDEHEGETILANMPETKCVDGVHYFDTTVKMSTYLVAFGFGELQGKTATTKSGVKVGVFGTYAHAEKELDFGLDIATRAIEFYEDFFQTPYPLPHSWQLGLPDFSAGAMENWGLITYREAYLLLDPDNTSLTTKRAVATVIAHEVAHQWFGDLVTMKWWDDLWLNESFANMMEYVCVDAIEPDLHVWESFQTKDVPAALHRDATDGVQSVHVAVEDPAEVDSLFDAAIVYAKGARMLVMVRALIGDDALRQGLKAYFAKHQYGNATGADLWSALGDASGIDVGAVMHSWLEQPGYPVVKASVQNEELILTQNQFFIGEGSDQQRIWQIPLASNAKDVPELMTERTLSLGNYAELRARAGEPFRLNVGNNSHFIVQYDDTLLADILSQVSDYDALTQLQLLQDLKLLASGRYVSYATLVPLLLQFADSTHAIVNQALYNIADEFDLFVEPNTEEEANLKQYYHKLSHKNYTRLGCAPKDADTNDDQLSRPLVIRAALYGGNKDTIAEAHDLFTAHKDAIIDLPAAVRAAILLNEVRAYGSEALFESFLQAYRRSSDANFKQDLQVAMTQTKEPVILEAIVAKFKEADTIKPQDLRGWFYSVLANPLGEQLAWDWIRTNWQWLLDTVGGDMSFTSYIQMIARVFRTSERLAEYKAFFEPKLNTPGLTREITMGINVITSRVALITAEKEAVNKSIAREI
ncbi:M1 family metallopeptidase [Enterococcus italicus]|uniref:M1 family metallopeptidase n=1 Tax=Enterococcus italicus TaxID=246144 RepID=UPI0028B08DB9|nr:M1 family metallopeptidase [Enterococcus italicus]